MTEIPELTLEIDDDQFSKWIHGIESELTDAAKYTGADGGYVEFHDGCLEVTLQYECDLNDLLDIQTINE